MISHVGYLMSQFAEDEREPLHTCAQCARIIDTENGDPDPVEVLMPCPNATGMNPFTSVYFCNQVCCSQAAYEATDTASGRAELLLIYAGLHLTAMSLLESRAPAADRYDLIPDVRIGEPGAWKFLTFAEFKQAAAQFLAALEPAGDEAAWALPASRAIDQMSESLSAAAKESFAANVSGKKVQ